MEEVQMVQDAAQAAEASGGIGALGLNAKIFIAQLINFTIVLIVLWKWAYKPIVRLLEQRQEKIEKSVKDAEEIEDRLGRLETEREGVISEAKAEAQKIIDEAMGIGDARKVEMLKQAKSEVEAVVAKGKAQLESEKQQMIEDAKAEMANIALLATKKILSEEIDEAKSMKLAKAVIKEMS